MISALLMLAVASSLEAACNETSLPAVPQGVARAIAVLNGRTLNGSVISGTISFTQLTPSCGLTIAVNVSGLDAGQGDMFHGLNVHQNGIQTNSNDIITGKIQKKQAVGRLAVCVFISISQQIDFNFYLDPNSYKNGS
jgi:hypothetical protein